MANGMDRAAIHAACLNILHLAKSAGSLFGAKGNAKEVIDLIKNANSVLASDTIVVDANANQVSSAESSPKSVVYEIEELLDTLVTARQQMRNLGYTLERGWLEVKFYRYYRRRFNKLCEKSETFGKLVTSGKTTGVSESRDLNESCDEIEPDLGPVIDFRDQIEPDLGPVIDFRDQIEPVSSDVETLGREEDLKLLKHVLLNENANEDLMVLPVVGVAGIGKTALMQLAFQDAEVNKHFDRLLWASVSNFDLEAIIRNVLSSATDQRIENLDLEELKTQLRGVIGGTKYLLVLNGLRNCNPAHWDELRGSLDSGASGSAVVVTTRSSIAASVMGTVPQYDLGGLSEDNAWTLFEKCAFHEGRKDPRKVKIGREIVKKCRNVPLAIRTSAGLLRCKNTKEWLNWKKFLFTSPEADESDGISAVLKFSYHDLPPLLKHSFSYISIFPENYEISKNTLIHLWMAEGCLVDTEVLHVMDPEDVGENFIKHLSGRGFFSAIKDNEGSIVSCKVHSLMHELICREVSDMKMIGTDNREDINDMVHHISAVSVFKSELDVPPNLVHAKKLRSFLLPNQPMDGGSGDIKVRGSSFDNLFSQSFRSLRILDLHGMRMERLPDSIGDLIHVRYLDLSSNDLQKLPSSVCNLHNLQTLLLRCCAKLKKLPKYCCKLVNLRHLDITACSSLNHMPSKIGLLNSLRTLGLFVVGGPSCGLDPRHIGGLEDLKALVHIKGQLVIKLNEKLNEKMICEISKAEQQTILEDKIHLTDLTIEWQSRWVRRHLERNQSQFMQDDDDMVLRALHPPDTLRKLSFRRYKGKMFPSWASAHSLPRLVAISLWSCTECERLPSFHQLTVLKKLYLKHLPRLEYMQNTTVDPSSVFFPSLDSLTLWDLPKLKAWWNDSESSTSAEPHSFGSLSSLLIQNCSLLESLPLCPKVKSLTLKGVDRHKLSVMDAMSTSVKNLVTDNEDFIRRFQLSSLEHLEITGSKLEKLSDLDNGSCSMSTVQFLKITDCRNFRTFCTESSHLEAIKKLQISHCPNLDFAAPEDVGGGPWKRLKNLQSLQFDGLPKLVALPEGILNTTTLQSLEVSSCPNLMALPEWISGLKSLRQLRINNCKLLKFLPESMRDLTALKWLEIRNCVVLIGRCQPGGAERHKIEGVDNVRLS